jgi:pyruvate decarboxylase/indolepyruvate decarboxylase
MFRQVTCAAVRILHPDNAAEMIDYAITTALRERKPDYIEIACNLSNAPCPEPAPFESVMVEEGNNSRALALAVERASAILNNSAKPILLAGPHLRAFRAIDTFRELAEAIGCGVAVMPSAKSFFPETHPQYVGIYFGGVSSPGCEAIVDWADIILAAGPVFNDYTTVGWTALPSKERLISAEPRYVRTADAEFTNVAMEEFLSTLAKNVKNNDTTVQEYARITRSTLTRNAVRPGDNDALTRAELWRQIEDEIDGKSTLLVETGDSWLNGLDVRLPEGARFEIEMQWGSIGWATRPRSVMRWA